MPKDVDFSPVLVPRIKYIGVFDLQELLKTMKDWFIHQDYEFHEDAVKYKVPSPAGAEIEYEWRGEREVNSYVKYYVYVVFHLWDVKEVEVVKDGKKKKSNHGKMQLEMWGKAELDWSNRFGGSKFLQFLGDFYNNYIIRKDIFIIWADRLYYRVYKLHRVVKDFLDMEAKTNAFQEMW